MQTFSMGKITIVCEGKSTRGGFKHTATLLTRGYERTRATCQYVNRTWESFEYALVLQKVLEKTNAITKRQKTMFLKKLKG